MNGETYARIESKIGGGSRVKLKNDNTWELTDEDPSFNAWVDRNGNQFFLGVISSILAGVIIYAILKSKN